MNILGVLFYHIAFVTKTNKIYALALNALTLSILESCLYLLQTWYYIWLYIELQSTP